MTNNSDAGKKKRPVRKFLLDRESGHVLSASLDRGTLTRAFTSSKYADDPNAQGYRMSDLSERVREFLVGAKLLTKVKDVDIFCVKDYAFAVYHGGDSWGTTFLNCVLITNSVEIRRSAAKQFGMRLVVGLTGWLYFQTIRGLSMPTRRIQ